MNRVKRWSMSVSSWVDGVLAQVENHEASVDAAIVRVRKSIARARVQLRRVERDHHTLKDTKGSEEEAAVAWRRRARNAEDENAALECLRRAKIAERRTSELEHRVAEHERIHKELNVGVRQLNGRLRELIERRNLMRTRASRAEAVHGMANVSGPIGDVDDLFDRWETRVSELEISADCDNYVDSFEADFDTIEETAALREELRELRGDKQ